MKKNENETFFGMNMENGMHQRLKVEAKKKQRSMSSLVRWLIDCFLKNEV